MKPNWRTYARAQACLGDPTLLVTRQKDQNRCKANDALEGNIEFGKPNNASLFPVNLHIMQAGWYGTRRMMPALSKQCRGRYTPS
jgi:hypothetical protein